MGHQPSTLNCKINDNEKKGEITATKQFVIKDIKSLHQRNENIQSQKYYPSQNIAANKSPRNISTRTNSQKSLFMRSPRHEPKSKIFIPQHECITKVSQFPFKFSNKGKKFYVEQKSKQLGQIIQSRYNTMKHFPYSQILGLTECLVYSLAHLVKKNCNHHDFYPTNVYYIDGRFKVINPLELQSSGFYLTAERQRFSFLSPELIIAILQEKKQDQLGGQIMNKADIFAIGMILLQVCTLQPSSECYDEESYNIIDSVIKERISKVAKIYTPTMAECINLMLQYEVEERVNPILLAQLIHLKIQNEKQIAFQIQNPKNSPQQMPGKAQSPTMNPQNNRIPQQMVQRGPPPPLPPPYTHQPFRMQNVNPNVIAVSVPNEVYTRISPNNQGFLSSSSLQQKLRVIQLIKENPNEQDSQGQEEKYRKKILMEKKISNNQNMQNLQNPNTLKIQPRDQLQNPMKIQYPMVESVYTTQPLNEVPIQIQSQKQNIVPTNNFLSPIYQQKTLLQNDPKQPNQNNFYLPPENQLQRKDRNLKQQQFKAIPKSNFVTNNLSSVNNNVPLVISEPKEIYMAQQQQPYYGYNNFSSPASYPQQQQQNIYTLNQNYYNKESRQENFVYNKLSMNYPPQNTNQNMTLPSNYQPISRFNKSSDQISRPKYGTSTENQSLQQKVQRVLQMSRNVK